MGFAQIDHWMMDPYLPSQQCFRVESMKQTPGKGQFRDYKILKQDEIYYKEKCVDENFYISTKLNNHQEIWTVKKHLRVNYLLGINHNTAGKALALQATDLGFHYQHPIWSPSPSRNDSWIQSQEQFLRFSKSGSKSNK